MQLTSMKIIEVILCVAAGNMLMRFLPFLIFPEHKKIPAYIVYLGSVLPYAVISMLVVYCFKGISFSQKPFGIPELAAASLVVGLQARFHLTFLSIASGVCSYMFLLKVFCR